MLRIKDNVYLGVTIGGKEYPLEATGFTNLKIVSTLDNYVPMLELKVVDSLNFFTERITLADGLPVLIQLGASKNESADYYFRVHKFKEHKENGASHYTITGYLDVPLFYLATANTPLTGTSTSVLQTIAGYGGLTFLGDNTSDNQTWIPKNDRYCVWAENIMAHAYAGGSSLMRIGVTPLKQLRYRDVMKLDISSQLPSFVNSDPRTGKRIFQMVDNQSISRSGANNIAGGGYGHRLVVQRARNEIQTTKDKIEYRRFSPFLEVSREVRSLLTNAVGSPGVQNVQFTPIDCGNTHEQYWESEYQNKRLARLFSLGATWQTEARTGVELLDPVNYLPQYSPGMTKADVKEQAKGIYVVTAKSIKVQMGNYFERFEAYTTGANSDPTRNQSQE